MQSIILEAPSADNRWLIQTLTALAKGLNLMEPLYPTLGEDTPVLRLTDVIEATQRIRLLKDSEIIQDGYRFYEQKNELEPGTCNRIDVRFRAADKGWV